MAAAAGPRIPSLQALFLGRPGNQLMGDAAAFGTPAEHTRRIARTLGADAAVFGAPHNRIRGVVPEAGAEDLAAARLRTLGDIAQAAGPAIALQAYGVPGTARLC